MRKRLLKNNGSWKNTAVLTVGIFVVFSLYLFARRGYYNLYIANKLFGSTAAILAGISLLIGPLAKKRKGVKVFLPMRKSLGLVAFGLGLVHFITSAFFLPNKFPLSWYQREWLPIVLGLIALSIWIYLAYLSGTKSIIMLGVTTWRQHHRIGGIIAFWAIFLHLVIMKYQGWIKWLNGQVPQTAELVNPSYPPASLFVFFIIVSILIYRVVHSLQRR